MVTKKELQTEHISFRCRPSFLKALDNYVKTEGFKYATPGNLADRGKVVKGLITGVLKMNGYLDDGK